MAELEAAMDAEAQNKAVDSQDAMSKEKEITELKQQLEQAAGNATKLEAEVGPTCIYA